MRYRVPCWLDLIGNDILKGPLGDTQQHKSHWVISFTGELGEVAMWLYLNLSQASIEEDGVVEIMVEQPSHMQFSHLDKEFLDPLFPTQEESALFEIEHGVEYPLLRFLETVGDWHEEA